MDTRLSGLRIAVVGGDRRQLALIDALVSQGSRLVYFGLPDWAELAGIEQAGSFEAAVSEAKVVVLPISGTDAAGTVRTVEGVPPVVLDEQSFGMLRQGTLLATGSLRPHFRIMAERAGVQVLEYAEENEIAILNSIPTAEGAIQIAMQELPITVHGSNAFVLGFGRCAVTLARMLHALGAHTFVYARRSAQLARAIEMGITARPLDVLADEIGTAHVIFNTVPAMLLPEALLGRTDPTVLIVDIASSPGGTDFEAARRLGRKAVLSLGLPGKVAPVTAGKVLASALPGLIVRALASR